MSHDCPCSLAGYVRGITKVVVEPEAVDFLWFLLSDASGYVTRVMLPVDGGYLTF
ncbi:MAG: hypothetical protein RIC36_05660 [Rhodospirillales bacterium]